MKANPIDETSTGRGKSVAARQRRFITTQTRVEPVALVPEVRMHAATELSPLWAATQSDLDLAAIEPPFWAFAWPGGQALARFVLDQPSVVRGLRVLDFATGSGLVGIAAALAGAASVLSADIDPLACVAAKLNARASKVKLRTTQRDLVGGRLSNIDVVLAGDVFYEKPAAERFGAWFRALRARGLQVYVGDPGRAYFPSGLERVAHYQVPVAFEIESATTKPCGVYRF
ncbi:MAG: 50S ribosomal protein L11 methyltransferase [Polyangiaceae bacterium]